MDVKRAINDAYFKHILPNAGANKYGAENFLFIFTLIFKFFPSKANEFSIKNLPFQQVSRRKGRKRFNHIFRSLMECQNVWRSVNGLTSECIQSSVNYNVAYYIGYKNRKKVDESEIKFHSWSCVEIVDANVKFGARQWRNQSFVRGWNFYEGKRGEKYKRQSLKAPFCRLKRLKIGAFKPWWKVTFWVFGQKPCKFKYFS